MTTQSISYQYPINTFNQYFQSKFQSISNQYFQSISYQYFARKNDRNIDCEINLRNPNLRRPKY